MRRLRLRPFITEHARWFKLAALGIAVGIAAFVVWYFVRSDLLVTRTDPNSSTAQGSVIEFKPSPLTGRIVSPELAARPVYAVMIENSLDARPQSSLIDAGVVFEIRAEGGITRFLTLFQEAEPAVIGPIRSLRPYYIDYLMGFDPAVLHVGGSPEAKSLIGSLGLTSLDVAGAYYRATDRFAPHNAYSSYETVARLMRERGFTSSDFTPLKRGDPAPLETPTAATISIDISSSLFNVTYRYDAACNCYLRNLGGGAHTDRESGRQLAPDVVVVIKAEHSTIDNVGRVGIDTTGTGEAWVFQNGGATKATWRKASRTDQLSFTDANGAEIALNPGQTWITVIPTDQSVTYRP